MIYLFKAIEALLMPPLSAIILILWGVFSKKARVLKIMFGLIWLTITSLPITALSLYALLEAPYVKHTVDNIETRKTAVVLGGYLKESSDGKGLYLFDPIDRLELGRKVILSGKVDRLLLTGGNIYQEGIERSESIVARELLIDWGVNPRNVIVEARSRTTMENARNCAKLLNEDRDIILITSATHMRRAMWAFEKVGFKPTALVAEKSDIPPIRALLSWRYFFPNARALKATNIALHEVLGLLAYRVMYR